MTPDARPERTSHRPDDDVVLPVDSVVAQRVSLVLTRLGDEVLRFADEVAVGGTRVSLGTLDEGVYAVRVTTADGSTATSAVDVTAAPLARRRCGFVTDFLLGRENGDELADSLRAFHYGPGGLRDVAKQPAGTVVGPNWPGQYMSSADGF